MKKNVKSFLLILLVLFVMGGCNRNGQKKDSKFALLKTTNPAPVQIQNHNPLKAGTAARVKHDISSFPEIYDVAVVQGKKDTLVAYKVKHMQRFRMKSIEAKINKLLEKKYPKENFSVSSDYKIFLEAVKLREQMKNPKFTAKKAEKKLQEIIKLKDETT
ncbi:sporulation protein [Bacillota bacterium Lsc_1132]